MVLLSGSVLSVLGIVPFKKKSLRKIPGLRECEHLFGSVRCFSAGKNNTLSALGIIRIAHPHSSASFIFFNSIN